MPFDQLFEQKFGFCAEKENNKKMRPTFLKKGVDIPNISW